MNPRLDRREAAGRGRRGLERWTAAILALALCWAASTPARAETAGSFVRMLGDDVVAVLKEKSLDETSRREALRAIFLKSFDGESIARFVLGRYWRTASEDQKRRYLAVFPAYVADIYAGRLTGYSGEMFVVLRERAIDAQRMHVATEIRRPAGAPLSVDFRVRRTDSEFRIFDAKVEGVSLLITKRDEFAAVIRRQGIDGLLSILERRTEGMIKG